VLSVLSVVVFGETGSHVTEAKKFETSRGVLYPPPAGVGHLQHHHLQHVPGLDAGADAAGLGAAVASGRGVRVEDGPPFRVGKNRAQAHDLVRAREGAHHRIGREIVRARALDEPAAGADAAQEEAEGARDVFVAGELLEGVRKPVAVLEAQDEGA